MSQVGEENGFKSLSLVSAKTKHFFHRAGLYDQITAKLDKKRALILYGKPGTGKSSLARHYAESFMSIGGLVREVKCQFTNKILQNMFELVAESKRYKGNMTTIEKKTLLDEITQLLNELNGKRSVLFIFENVEFFDRIEEYFSILPDHVRVLVITRNEKLPESFSEQSADCMRVGDFTREEFTEYIEKTFEAKSQPPLTADQLERMHNIVRISLTDSSVRPVNANKLVVLVLNNIDSLHVEDFIKLTRSNWNKLFVN